MIEIRRLLNHILNMPYEHFFYGTRNIENKQINSSCLDLTFTLECMHSIPTRNKEPSYHCT